MGWTSRETELPVLSFLYFIDGIIIIIMACNTWLNKVYKNDTVLILFVIPFLLVIIAMAELYNEMAEHSSVVEETTTKYYVPRDQTKQMSEYGTYMTLVPGIWFESVLSSGFDLRTAENMDRCSSIVKRSTFLVDTSCKVRIYDLHHLKLLRDTDDHRRRVNISVVYLIKDAEEGDKPFLKSGVVVYFGFSDNIFDYCRRRNLPEQFPFRVITITEDESNEKSQGVMTSVYDISDLLKSMSISVTEIDVEQYVPYPPIDGPWTEKTFTFECVDPIWSARLKGVKYHPRTLEREDAESWWKVNLQCLKDNDWTEAEEQERSYEEYVQTCVKDGAISGLDAIDRIHRFSTPFPSRGSRVKHGRITKAKVKQSKWK